MFIHQKVLTLFKFYLTAKPKHQKKERKNTDVHKALVSELINRLRIKCSMYYKNYSSKKHLIAIKKFIQMTRVCINTNIA